MYFEGLNLMCLNDSNSELSFQRPIVTLHFFACKYQ